MIPNHSPFGYLDYLSFFLFATAIIDKIDCDKTLFDKPFDVIDNVDDLKKIMTEVLIRFDTSPDFYTKSDYALLLTVLYKTLSSLCVSIAALCAVFIIVVILLQPANSDGMSALGGGASDTFYGHKKSKTLEHKLKILTGICIGVIMVLMVLFFVLYLI